MKNRFTQILICATFVMIANISFGQKNVVDTILNLENKKNDSLLVENDLNKSTSILVDEVLAIVGDKIVLLSDFYTQSIIWKQQRGVNPRARLSDMENRDILEQMLSQKLLAIGAIADSLETSEAVVIGVVENRINDMVRELGSVKAVEDLHKVPMYQIREMVSKQTIEEFLANSMKGVIQRGVTITPMEVKKFARQMSKDSVDIIPRQVSYAHIVKKPRDDYDAKMNVKADLLELRKRIVNGASFSALARMYSDDKSTAIRGGELDYSALNGDFEPEFENEIKSLKVGGISGIIETTYGFHIIQLIDIKNEMYKVRHILMRMEMSMVEVDASMKLLDSVVLKIKSNEIKFEDAVQAFTDDNKSKTTGGVVLNMRSAAMRGVKGQSPRFFVDELMYDSRTVMDLKVGEVSESFVTYDPLNGDQICKIIKLTGDFPEHRANVIDDYSYFEDRAIAEKTENEYNEWIRKRIKRTYIRIDEPYNKSKFRFDWTKNTVN